jgi:hypothetical protein
MDRLPEKPSNMEEEDTVVEEISDRELNIGYWYRGQQNFTLSYRFQEPQKSKSQKKDAPLFTARENSTTVFVIDDENSVWREIASRNMTSHFLSHY